MRVFAVDLRPRSFGFAVFEGQSELLDWGVRSFRRGVNAVKVPLRAKLRLLFNRYGPDLVLLKVPTTAKLRRKVSSIAGLAHCLRIQVALVSGASIRAAFPESNKNKDQIAAAIASRYPELRPRLGPKRKSWQAERYSMSIFDATALGCAYFMRKPKVSGALKGQLIAPPQ